MRDAASSSSTSSLSVACFVDVPTVVMPRQESSAHVEITGREALSRLRSRDATETHSLPLYDDCSWSLDRHKWTDIDRPEFMDRSQQTLTTRPPRAVSEISPNAVSTVTAECNSVVRNRCVTTASQTPQCGGGAKGQGAFAAGKKKF